MAKKKKKNTIAKKTNGDLVSLAERLNELRVLEQDHIELKKAVQSYVELCTLRMKAHEKMCQLVGKTGWAEVW